MLHTTKRRTQPWKTGLPVDFTLRERGCGPIPAAPVRPVLRFWTARARYEPHPDPNQETYLFALLAECLDLGEVTRDEVEDAVGRRHVRPDALALAERHRGRFPPAAVVAAPGRQQPPDPGRREAGDRGHRRRAPRGRVHRAGQAAALQLAPEEPRVARPAGDAAAHQRAPGAAQRAHGRVRRLLALRRAAHPAQEPQPSAGEAQLSAVAAISAAEASRAA